MDNAVSINNPISITSTQKVEESNEKLIKFKRILRMTLTNTVNLNNRIKKRDLFSNSILIYYSIFLIVYSITGKYFADYFNTTLAEYFNLILSIVLLVFSLINNSANYGTRIQNSSEILHKLRNIRRTVDLNNYEEKELEYNEVIKDLESRSNGDFFKTLKSECKQNGTNWISLTLLKANHCSTTEISKLREHLCEIHPFWEQVKLIGEWLLYLILIFTPILVFVLCFSIKLL